MRRRHALTDEQRDQIRGHLPGKASDPGRTAADNRLFVNAVFFVLKTGIPWADLPARFGKPNTVWKRYDRKRFKRRNLVERFFRAIKGCRRVVIRYE
ncbi:MAG: transposase [Planctomycetota bacterium]